MHSIPPMPSSSTLKSAIWLWPRAIAATRSSGSCTSMAPISRFTSNTLPTGTPARARLGRTRFRSAQKRQLAVAARQRRHAIERQLHLDGTHQPIHFEHLADRHAGARAAGHRLRARLEGVVAVDARGANGRVGAHIAKRRHALDGLDAPDRLPGDRRLRRGTVLRFELCPGPALKIVRQALVVGKVPLAHRPIAEEASALGIGALADELQALHRKRQVAALALGMLGGGGW